MGSVSKRLRRQVHEWDEASGLRMPSEREVALAATKQARQRLKRARKARQR